jgi:hypothetical protein
MVLEIEYTTAAVELQTPKFSATAMVFVGTEAPILGISLQGVLSVIEIYRQLRLIQFGGDPLGSRHFVPSTNLD